MLYGISIATTAMLLLSVYGNGQGSMFFQRRSSISIHCHQERFQILYIFVITTSYGSALSGLTPALVDRCQHFTFRPKKSAQKFNEWRMWSRFNHSLRRPRSHRVTSSISRDSEKTVISVTKDLEPFLKAMYRKAGTALNKEIWCSFPKVYQALK